VRRMLLIAGAAAFIAFALFAIERAFWLIDDRNHPDGMLLREEFAAAQKNNTNQISVLAVNGGSWLALCLAGAGENPQEVLRAFGRSRRIRVPTVQRMRSWLYAGRVPQGEMALVLVTERNSVRSRRLPNLTGNANFKSACAVRADAGLAFR
jgi:hypothetical protein